MASLRILIVEDEPGISEPLSSYLAREGFEPTVAPTIGAAREAFEATEPDVVLLDVQMPHVDGLAAARTILRRRDPPKVLMLTTFDIDDYVTDALIAGACGYLLKDVDPDTLIAAVHAATRGDMPLAPSVTKKLAAAYLQRPPPQVPDPRLVALTPREREILSALGRGMTNAEIVAELHVSLSTVKTHVAAVLAKLGLRDRVQAAIAAHELDLNVGDNHLANAATEIRLKDGHGL